MKPVRILAAMCALCTCAVIGAPASAMTPGTFGDCPEVQASPELAASECAVLSVPLDPSDETGEQIDLFVRRFPALAEREGEFWLLAGGPGESGASFYGRIAAFQARFPHYDILVPDHRGTGRSSRLCEGETIGSEAGSALAGAEFGPCFGEIWQNAERTRQFSMTHAARDLDTLIGRLGRPGKRWIYAVSYGTGLALRFGQLHAQPVDGMILDSLVPALDDDRNDLSHRSQTVDAVGRIVLADCAADPACNGRFDGGVEAAYADLLEDLDAGARPGLVAVIPGGNIRNTLGTMLDVPAARALVPDVIAAAIDGPDNLRNLLDNQVSQAFAATAAVTDHEGAAFSITLAGLIGVSETNRRPELTAEEVADEEAGLLFTSPLTQLQTRTSMPAYPRDAWFDAPYEALPPVLVVHGTLDPKTTIEGAMAHLEQIARASEVTLVRIDRAPHAAWFFAPDCLDAAMRSFVDGGTPEPVCALPSMQ